MLTVITGPPCSGKTTYIREHAQPGDVRIDFDELAQALGSPVTHGHAAAITDVTRQARKAAVAAAIRWHYRGLRVWIIDTCPSEASWRQYALAGARVVRLTVTRGEQASRQAARKDHNDALPQARPENPDGKSKGGADLHVRASIL